MQSLQHSPCLRMAAFRDCQQGRNQVNAFGKKPYQLGVPGSAAFAYLYQQVFQAMGHGPNRLAPYRVGRALNRVHGPKKGLQAGAFGIAVG
ncbi:hypothetical protein Mgrana_02281 [Meiothermus granaticius NBRC 107808]|uniref:Uncharacterized protein n=1 Tax=Meiothermus granaticius NBRC 107808 TaxID=1227551 RepID=A0A399F7Y9_9DEIN|nr:hypothetical protein Mgrana_02281 [Meiothermus granaticius NBRC 107808]